MDNKDMLQAMLNERAMMISQLDDVERAAKDPILLEHYRPQIHIFTGLLDNNQQPIQDVKHVTVAEFVEFLHERLRENESAINDILKKEIQA